MGNLIQNQGVGLLPKFDTELLNQGVGLLPRFNLGIYNLPSMKISKAGGNADSGRGRGRGQGSGGGRGGNQGIGRGGNSEVNAMATAKFNEYCSKIASEGNYVDAESATATLQIENLHYLPAFREISKLNKIVENTFSCFIHLRSVCLYFELELIILKAINRYKHRGTSGEPPNFESFDEVGMGSLASNRNIAKFFNFVLPTIRSQIVQLKMEVIIDCALGLVATRYANKEFNIPKIDDETNNEYICVSLSKMYSCPRQVLGLVIRFKEFVHGRNNVINEVQLRNEMKKCYHICTQRFIDGYRDELFSSLNILRLGSKSISTSPATFGDQSKVPLIFMVLEDVGIDLQAEYINFLEFIDGKLLENGDSFENIFHSLQHQHKKIALLMSEPSNSSNEIDLVTVADLNSVELFEKLKGDESHIALGRKLPECMHALVSAFIFYLSIEDSTLTAKKKKSKSKGTSSTSTNESLVADAVNNFMNHRHMNDVPSFVINDLKEYINKIFHNSIKPTSNKDFSGMQHDMTAVNGEVKTSMNAYYKKGGFIMTKSTYMAIMASSIIMHRILKIDGSQQITASDKRDDILLLIPGWFKKGLEDKLTQGSTNSVLTILEVMCEIEEKIINSLNIPAFECLRRGSFIRYVCKSHMTLLTTLPRDPLNQSESVVRDEFDTYSQSAAVQTMMDEDDVINALTFQMKELVDELSIDGSSSDHTLTLLLTLEAAVLQSLKCVSFISATGVSLPDFISSLLERSEQEQGEERILSDFCDSYQKLRSALFALYNDGDSSGQTQNDALIVNTSSLDPRLLESETLKRAVLQYRGRAQEGSLKDFLFCVLGISVSEKEEAKLLSDSPSVSPRSSVLHFYTPSVGVSFTFPGDTRVSALRLLSAVPIGHSCMSNCIWKCYEGALNCSLVDFVIREEAELLAIRSKIAYVAVYNGAIGDCIPVPTDSSSSFWNYENEVRTSFRSDDHCAVGAWALSAAVGLISIVDFKDAIEIVIRAQLKTDGLDPVLHLFIRSTVALPSPVRSDVLLLLLSALATESSTSLPYLQEKLFRKYWMKKMGATTVSRATLTELIGDVSHSDAFAPLLQAAIAIGEEVESSSSSSSASMKVNSSSNPNRLVEYSGNSNESVAENKSWTTPDESTINGLLHTAVISASEARSDSYDVRSLSVGEGGAIIARRQAYVRDLLIERFDYDSEGVKKQETPAGKMLSTALSILAVDLYSDGVHFVMELVQNADDNKYHPDSYPSLLIDLHLNEIIVHNNELGFEEENISAICNLGQSTKQVKHIYSCYDWILR